MYIDINNQNIIPFIFVQELKKCRS